MRRFKVAGAGITPSEQKKHILIRAQECIDNDIPVLSNLFDKYDDVKDRIAENSTIRRYKKKFKEIGVSSALSTVDGLISDVARSYDIIANAAGVNPLESLGINPSDSKSSLESWSKDHFSVGACKKAIKNFVFSDKHKTWMKTTVAMPAISGALGLVGASSMAPMVMSAAVIGAGVLKAAYHIHTARRERQKKDDVRRSNSNAGLGQVLASGTAAAVAGGSLGKGVTVSGAWSRASGTTRSQVFKDDASVKNLKLKVSVFIHDIETLQSSILKINDSVETLKEKCVAFDGASNVGEEILRLCEDGADGIENSSNSLSRICEKLNDFKNAL